MEFIKQLNFGKKYEIKFAELTKKKYIQSDGLEYWDIIIYENDKPIKYEIETDKMANKTGNFVIEYQSNGKDSGIKTTEADYWVFNEIIDYDKIKGDNYDYKFISYLIPLDELKNIIKTKPTQLKSGCEFGKNKIMLINKKYLEKYKVNFDEYNFHIKKIIKNKPKEYTIEELELMISSF